MKNVILLIVLFSIPTLALAHEESMEGKGAMELFEKSETIIVPYVANPGVTIDGKIGAAEYSNYGRFVDEDTGMQAYLEHDGNSLYVGLKSPGNGWIAIGFGNDAKDMEKGANVIMGYMDNGTLALRDDYAPKIDGEMKHDPVENFGGKNDIISAKGTEDSSGTTIEFVVSLNSTDKYGRHLEAGNIYPLIIAWNNSLKEFNPTLDEGEIHFEKIYVARQNDNLKEISNLFSMNISPTNAVAGAIILGISFALLLIAYYPWRKMK
jgi:hypothetical protein